MQMRYFSAVLHGFCQYTVNDLNVIGSIRGCVYTYFLTENMAPVML